MNAPKILLDGDSAVTVQFGETIDPAVYARVAGLNEALKKLPAGTGITETVPTYRSLLVHYDPRRIRFQELKELLLRQSETAGNSAGAVKKVITIPCSFGGSHGEDLPHVAEYHHTTEEEIVRRFCAEDFLIYFLGFTPGYPYIGGISEELATPRLSSPRVKIPAGAVGIGGMQLGIYPIVSPGGFQLVGQTPLRLYDPRKENPVLLEAGEFVRFQSVDEETFRKIEADVEAGTCVPEIREG